VLQQRHSHLHKIILRRPVECRPSVPCKRRQPPSAGCCGTLARMLGGSKCWQVRDFDSSYCVQGCEILYWHVSRKCSWDTHNPFALTSAPALRSAQALARSLLRTASCKSSAAARGFTLGPALASAREQTVSPSCRATAGARAMRRGRRRRRGAA
jgi:hypothetical protein